MPRVLYIEQSECYGCGNCEAICPGVFQMNATGKFAQVLNPDGGNEDCILEAMASCPAQCIRWAEE